MSSFQNVLTGITGGALVPSESPPGLASSGQDRFFFANGLRLHFVTWGSAAMPPVLLLHGGSLMGRAWERFAELLERDYFCTAPDARGHGDSDWSPDGDYGLEASLKDTVALLDHLGIGAAIIVGQSSGGMQGMELAARHPARVTHLVIVDVGPELDQQAAQHIRNFNMGSDVVTSPEEFVRAMIRHGSRRPVEVLRRQVYQNVRQLPDGRWTWKFDRRFRDPAVRQVANSRWPELWDTLRGIQCPTLIVRGGRSRLFPEATARRMQELVPGSWLVTVPRAGHTVMMDNPEGLAREVLVFLAEARGR